MKWNPEDYAKSSDAQLKWAQELRQNLNLQGYESVIDVGCGDGKITADFAKTLPKGRVTGVDSSPEMIAYATRIYPLEQYSNLSFACVDARSLNFEQEFDLCFSNAVLHWVDDHPAFLHGAHRSLRSGGQLAVSCGGKGGAADVLQVFSELVVCESWQRYFNGFHNPYFFYGDQEYSPWLKEAGFAIERLELVLKDMTHRGKDGLASWIRTTWIPFTQRIPENERDNFINHFVDNFINHFVVERIPLDHNGLAHIHMVRLEVNALKP